MTTAGDGAANGAGVFNGPRESGRVKPVAAQPPVHRVPKPPAQQFFSNNRCPAHECHP